MSAPDGVSCSSFSLPQWQSALYRSRLGSRVSCVSSAADRLAPFEDYCSPLNVNPRPTSLAHGCRLIQIGPNGRWRTGRDVGVSCVLFLPPQVRIAWESDNGPLQVFGFDVSSGPPGEPPRLKAQTKSRLNDSSAHSAASSSRSFFHAALCLRHSSSIGSFVEARTSVTSRQ